MVNIGAKGLASKNESDQSAKGMAKMSKKAENARPT